MTNHLLPVLYTLFLWWFSTGAILYLDGLPRRTFRWSLLGATVILAGAVWGLTTSREDATLGGAYHAFTSALLIWGWLEVSFLLGYVTGPRKHACPAGCRGPRHVLHAIETILYHELALIVAGAAVVTVSWGAANQVGLWTFLALWVMRQSAKLNLFLGVRNLSEDLLPPHLKHLERYFTRKPMNLLFPISVTAATAVAAVVWYGAFTAATAYEATGLTFLGTLLTLAVLEHWFLVLPLPANALWSWGLKSRTQPLESPHGLVCVTSEDTLPDKTPGRPV